MAEQQAAPENKIIAVAKSAEGIREQKDLRGCE
jgi:hypothetical protein